MKRLSQLIHHPEAFDQETLYALRGTVALYPYYQTARLLMLQNLYVLHDPAFDTELRKAALYISDRRTLFQLVEAAHYQLPRRGQDPQPQPRAAGENRTLSLIDDFLDSIPADEGETPVHREPTAADATVDYVAYLMECEGAASGSPTPAMKGQSLIDDFIEGSGGRITLKEEPEYLPECIEETDTPDPTPHATEESPCTEEMAGICIRNGQYQRALEIITRLNLSNPQKNIYFADQIRFLQKLVLWQQSKP